MSKKQISLLALTLPVVGGVVFISIIYIMRIRESIRAVIEISHEREDESSLKIGTIDINKIVYNYEKHKKEKHLLKEKIETMKGEIEDREKELEKYLIEQDSEKDPVKRKEIAGKIDKVRTEGILDIKFKLNKLKDRKKVLIMGLYKEICVAVEIYAKENKYEMVMVDLGSEVEGETTKEILNKINARTVIYADKKYDITDAVIKFMNKN